MEQGSKIVAEFERMFGKLTATEREWLTRRIADAANPIHVAVEPIGTCAIQKRDGIEHVYALRTKGDGWLYQSRSGRQGLWCPVDAADVPQHYKDAIAGLDGRPSRQRS